MREIIEDVYEFTCNFYDALLCMVVKGFLIITSPLWVIPYGLITKRKGAPEE